MYNYAQNLIFMCKIYFIILYHKLQILSTIIYNEKNFEFFQKAVDFMAKMCDNVIRAVFNKISMNFYTVK